MSATANLSDTAANAEAAALAPLFNSGLMRVYTGVQPLTANTALSGNTLLVTFTFAATAFPAPVAGILTANAIAAATSVASGTATFARIYKSDGTTVIADITAGVANAGLNLNATAIIDGTLIPINSFTFSVSET